MPNPDILIAFLLATAFFAYMPGPSTLYAAAQTIARGRHGGLMAAFGIHVGGYLHVVAAAFGLGILFDAMPVLYAGMKMLGAAYLIWLGLRFLVAAQLPGIDPLRLKMTSGRQAFWESAMVEILNPKTAIFYVAFLPQFTDTSALLPLWGQLLVLGTLVNAMFSSADLLCVFLAERINGVLRQSPEKTRWVNRVGGGVLIALGMNLATSNQAFVPA